MGRGKGKAQRLRRGRSPSLRDQRIVDATPERLAKSDHSDMVNPAEIDSTEQPIGRTRRFRDSWVDRMYRREQLTYAQWFACNWYAALHQRAFSSPRVVADYGTSGGGAGEKGYGIAQTEAQAAARKMYREARVAIPAQMLALVERVVIEDDMPVFIKGQQRTRFVMRFADAVQPLAIAISAPGA